MRRFPGRANYLFRCLLTSLGVVIASMCGPIATAAETSTLASAAATSTPAPATETSPSPSAAADETSTAVHSPAPIDTSLLLAFLADQTTFTLVDARSAEEFAVGHLFGAINVPHDAVDELGDSLPQDRAAPLVVYCKTGKRAASLAARLRERGYTDVRVLGPQQIFWSDTAPMFNCGVPAATEPAFLPPSE